MIGKKFLTLTEWTAFLVRKYVIVIKESHPHYRKRCKFLEMVGPNNLIAHPDNQQGLKIRMKAQIVASGEIIYLKHDEFFVEEGKLLFMPVNGHKFNR